MSVNGSVSVKRVPPRGLRGDARPSRAALRSRCAPRRARRRGRPPGDRRRGADPRQNRAPPRRSPATIEPAFARAAAQLGAVDPAPVVGDGDLDVSAVQRGAEADRPARRLSRRRRARGRARCRDRRRCAPDARADRGRARRSCDPSRSRRPTISSAICLPDAAAASRTMRSSPSQTRANGHHPQRAQPGIERVGRAFERDAVEVGGARDVVERAFQLAQARRRCCEPAPDAVRELGRPRRSRLAAPRCACARTISSLALAQQRVDASPSRRAACARAAAARARLPLRRPGAGARAATGAAALLPWRRGAARRAARSLTAGIAGLSGGELAAGGAQRGGGREQHVGVAARTNVSAPVAQLAEKIFELVTHELDRARRRPSTRLP